MTLAQLAVTVFVLGVLGLVASRFGLSAIPADLFAGLLLGPNEPKELSLIRPSEVTRRSISSTSTPSASAFSNAYSVFSGHNPLPP